MASRTCKKPHRAHPLQHSYELLRAVINGAERGVKKSLSRGADIEWSFEDYGTALQTAACIGDEQIVNLLLQKGSEVNTQRGQYGNALQAAAASGHERVVKLLLKAGADVAAKGGIYDTALEAALRKGYPSIAGLLVPEQTTQGAKRRTPLQLAASKGYDTVIQQLISYGSCTDSDKREATISALTQGHTSTAKLLVQRFGDLEHNGRRIFDAAVLAGNLELTHFLFEKGIRADKQSLVLAVARDKNQLLEDKDEVLALLIERYGGNIKTEGMLAAEKALKGNEVDLISAESLFKAGVQVDEYLLASQVCCKEAEELMLKYAKKGRRVKLRRALD